MERRRCMVYSAQTADTVRPAKAQALLAYPCISLQTTLVYEKEHKVDERGVMPNWGHHHQAKHRGRALTE